MSEEDMINVVRLAVENDRRQAHSSDDDKPFDDPEPEPKPDGSYTHVWRSKGGDFPCTPTGQEHRDEKDGRVWAQVINSDGGLSLVAKDELLTKAEAAAELKPKAEPSPDIATIVERELKKSSHGPFSDEQLEQFARLKREQPEDFKRLCQRYGALAAALAVKIDDFVAYMPQHNYFFLPTREPWPASSVDARLPRMVLVDAAGNPVLDKKGRLQFIPASMWLDMNRPVEQITWAPGEPLEIKDRLIAEGGWIKRPGRSVLNLYRPPTLIRCRGDVKPWLDHVHRVYPDDADHIIKWLAHRVQRPGDKINHALVLGGLQGIGKDTLLEPVKRAIGHWNFREVVPTNLFEAWTDFLRSVILRVNEARDLGDRDRFAFYDHMKGIIAAPPDVLRVNEKHIRQYYVPNVCGVIITTNHKSDGIYLPADDRRHHVAWSECKKEDFAADYWTKLYRWYDAGGDVHVAAYLAELPISGFDAKAPPPKTPAFWAIVDANRVPEDAELADALDQLGNPSATTLALVQNAARGDFVEWLGDRKNRRIIPHRMENCGYVPVRNPDADDGLWRINKKRQAVYAKADLSLRDQLAAAQRFAGCGKVVPLSAADSRQ